MVEEQCRAQELVAQRHEEARAKEGQPHEPAHGLGVLVAQAKVVRAAQGRHATGAKEVVAEGHDAKLEEVEEEA